MLSNVFSCPQMNLLNSQYNSIKMVLLGLPPCNNEILRLNILPKITLNFGTVYCGTGSYEYFRTTWERRRERRRPAPRVGRACCRAQWRLYWAILPSLHPAHTAIFLQQFKEKEKLTEKKALIKSPFFWQTKGRGSSTDKLVILNTNQRLWHRKKYENVRLVGVLSLYDLLSKASPLENKHSIQSVTLGLWLTPGSKERLTLDTTPYSLSHSLQPSCNCYGSTAFKYTEITDLKTEHQMLTLKEEKKATSGYGGISL